MVGAIEEDTQILCFVAITACPNAKSLCSYKKAQSITKDSDVQRESWSCEHLSGRTSVFENNCAFLWQTYTNMPLREKIHDVSGIRQQLRTLTLACSLEYHHAVFHLYSQPSRS